jgi:hypothetical protein
MNELHPILEITVRSPSGQITAHYVDRNDLITNNFVNFLVSLFTPPTGSTSSFTATDTSGISRTFVLRSQGGANRGPPTYALYTTDLGAVGGTIQVGGGTILASRTDTNLQTPYQSAVAVNTPAYDGTTGNVTVAASIVAQSATSVSESAFIIVWDDLSSALRSILLFHDVFPAIAVTSGSTIAVQYTFELLNTGFTNNFGNLLACTFTNTPGSGYASLSSTDTSNTVRSGFCYAFAAIGAIDNSGSYPYPRIGVGSGSTAPTRSGYSLATPACGFQTVTPPTILSGNILAIPASVTCVSATSITEADFELAYNINLSPPISVMFWRATFPAVSVPANTAITITFKVTLN